MFPKIQTQSQNLIRQVPAERVIRPQGFYKSIVLDALTVAAAAGLGFGYMKYLEGSVSYLVPLGVLVPFLVLSALACVLAKNLERRLAILALQAIGLVAFFGGTHETRSLAIAGVVLFVLFAWGELAARRELNNGLSIRFFRVVRPQIGKVLTGIILAGILLYLPRWSPETSFFSEDRFRRIFEWVARGLEQVYPEVRLTATVEEFSKSIARADLEKEPGFSNLPLVLQEELVAETAESVLNRLHDGLSRPFDDGASIQVSSLFYDALKATIDRWQQNFGRWFQVVWVIVVFVIARSIGAIAGIAVALVTFVCYEMLLAIDAIHVVSESRAHEVVKYS